jgi:hypothetical protein
MYYKLQLNPEAGKIYSGEGSMEINKIKIASFDLTLQQFSLYIRIK